MQIDKRQDFVNNCQDTAFFKEVKRNESNSNAFVQNNEWSVRFY